MFTFEKIEGKYKGKKILEKYKILNFSLDNQNIGNPFFLKLCLVNGNAKEMQRKKITGTGRRKEK